MKLFTKTFCAVMLFAGTLFPQVSGELTIANQNVIGTEFFFDIYLTRTETNDIYLGNGDMVLTFNSSAFTNPTFNKQSSSFWNLTSTTSNPVGFLYNLAMTAEPIVGNELIININLINFGGDQTGFNDFVARIDNNPSTHRLGRYRVTGISNPAASMNLQWKTSGTGVVTSLATYQTIDPWALSAINLTAVNPPDQPLPVELTSFTAAYKNSAVTLNWQTKTEVNNYGFNIERSINDGEWNNISFVEGHGNSNSPKEYIYIDKDLFAGGSNFQYRLKQIDTDGQFEYSDIVEVEVLPTQFELSQNYPNPFNPSTTIQFSLPQASQIKIIVYNMIGEQVATIADGMYESGYHKVVLDAANLSSGTYIYRLESSDFVQVKKMILLK